MAEYLVWLIRHAVNWHRLRDGVSGAESAGVPHLSKSVFHRRNIQRHNSHWRNHLRLLVLARIRRWHARSVPIACYTAR